MRTSREATGPETTGSGKETRKEPFDFAKAFPRLRAAAAPFPKAAMFQLFEEGYRTVFEQLVACIISIRTLDEVSLPIAKKLFTRARTARELSALSVDEIDAEIRASTFHYGKAARIRDIARRTDQEFGGVLPCDAAVLMRFEGVGPKCAHLTLGVACGEPVISVDTHVHRVTNRWGILMAPTPDKTLVALERVLPRAHWIEINELLVPFGKHICTARLPHCSTCPVESMCRQVGVTRHL